MKPFFFFSIAVCAAFAPCLSSGAERHDSAEIRKEMERILAELAPLKRLGFDEWKKKAAEFDNLVEQIDYSRPRPEFTGILNSVSNRFDDLLTAGFLNAVEARDATETTRIFTHFGACPIKARLAGVLEECPDNDFVARVMHAELDPASWTREALDNHFRARPNPASFRALSDLYYKKLLGKSGYGKVPYGFMEENCAPFRLRLEEKYPFLAEAEAETGTRNRNQPAPPADNPPPRPAASPGAQDNSQKPHPDTSSFPWMPAALAAAILALAFLSWRILRNRRSGHG